MEKQCNNCNRKEISYANYEMSEARHERREKRFFAVIILLILLLVGTNAAWLYYESQFETVTETESYEITQDGENANNNSIINGGEIVNGKTEN